MLVYSEFCSVLFAAFHGEGYMQYQRGLIFHGKGYTHYQRGLINFES